jgi:hypothetical protein
MTDERENNQHMKQGEDSPGMLLHHGKTWPGHQSTRAESTGRSRSRAYDEVK